MLFTGVVCNEMECISEAVLLRGSDCSLAMLILGFTRLFLPRETFSGIFKTSFKSMQKIKKLLSKVGKILGKFHEILWRNREDLFGEIQKQFGNILNNNRLNVQDTLSKIDRIFWEIVEQDLEVSEKSYRIFREILHKFAKF